jgi:hypothetical protein
MDDAMIEVREMLGLPTAHVFLCLCCKDQYPRDTGIWSHYKNRLGLICHFCHVRLDDRRERRRRQREVRNG